MSRLRVVATALLVLLGAFGVYFAVLVTASIVQEVGDAGAFRFVAIWTSVWIFVPLLLGWWGVTRRSWSRTKMIEAVSAAIFFLTFPLSVLVIAASPF